MKFLKSKRFQIALATFGIGGSLFFLFRLGIWNQLVWPGISFVLIISGIVGFEMICRGFRVKKIVSLLGEKISFFESLEIGALADVYGAATPSGVGGEVSRLASLVRLGVKNRDSMVILATDRLILLLSLSCVLTVSMITVFIKDIALLSATSLLNTLLLYSVLSLGLILFIGILIRRQATQYSWKKLLFQPSIFFLSMVHHIVRLGFLPLILWIFAHHLPTLQILIWSFILGYGISLMPIPSGGGSVEVTFMILFRPLLGEELSALVLLWWRFSSHYLYVLVGIVVVFQDLLKSAYMNKSRV